MNPRHSVLQTDALPTELPRQPSWHVHVHAIYHETTTTAAMDLVIHTCTCAVFHPGFCCEGVERINHVGVWGYAPSGNVSNLDPLRLLPEGL